MMMTYVCLDEKVFENFITIFVIDIKHEFSNFKFIHVIKVKKFTLLKDSLLTITLCAPND